MGLAKKLGKPPRRRSRGMAMVEMVFVLPLLLMVVFAIAEFGLMFSRWLTLSNAVREGARFAVVFRNPCDAATVESQTKTQVQNYASAGGIILADGDITVEGVGGVGGPCEGSDKPTKVSADHSFNFEVLPGFSSIAPTIVLSYESAMRNE